MNVLNRRRFVCALGGIAASCGVRDLLGHTSASRLFQRGGHALGTRVSLTVVHDSPAVANQALSAAFDALDHVEDVMSLYRPESQLSRLNRDRVLRDPHPDLVTVLMAAEELSRLTNGAFDITVQPLWSLFSSASRQGRIPSDTEIATVRSWIDWRAVEIAPDSIRLRGPETQITLNGIAQGFAVDLVSDTLRRHGIEDALIDTGEVAGIGHKPASAPWRVGIQDPHVANAYATLADLQDRCLATSGDYATTFTPDRMHHHVFDPRTRQSPTELSSVSVIASNGMWADGLSTAVCVLGVEDGKELLAKIPRAEAFFVDKSGKIDIHLAKQTTSKKPTTKSTTKPATSAPTTTKTRSKAEIEALISKEGKTPPDWFNSTPLNYPQTLKLDWPKDTGAWNNQINPGQYLWDVINPNPMKWKEGVRLMHHILKLNGKNQEVVKRAAGGLGHLYGDCLEDYARAAFWWRVAGADDLNLAHCYWKLGSKPMAEAILKQYSGDNTRHAAVIRLWAEMGEVDTALNLATKRAAGSTADVGYLVLGDIHRLTGRYPEALQAYQKVLDVKTGSRDLAANQKRARASIEAIKVFDTLDSKRIKDGKYRDKSLGYEADIEVEVTVKSGKIESVQVTQHREKQYYSALTDTPRQIIDKQGVKGVDATSGATITSEAIINATAKALAGAK